ncbi:ribonuclease P protein subunit p29 [Peromyscus californicus insignis]|uniref:ribonuclease P protein subunit p29 n=1 Tax=Peromyscus californicus insignis TaxID=564181 RepID=UPI0022A73DBB|nr:ribonuclease P protein subunit p29 [Peromyscus californicus insignis]
MFLTLYLFLTYDSLCMNSGSSTFVTCATGSSQTPTKSKCPSYVGVTGLLLHETKHVFKIITKEDNLKVIPKLNCVFTIEMDGFISYIYGSKFQLRSSERSAKKFKVKGTIDL